MASFRVGSTPRHYSRKADAWVDGPTQWYSVNCWRQLAQHVERSLRRGDPVVVHGRLAVRTWPNADGVEMTSVEVEAIFVGHDLNRGTTSFAKPARQGAPPAFVEQSGGLGSEGSEGSEGSGGRPAGDGAADDGDAVSQGHSSADGTGRVAA